MLGMLAALTALGALGAGCTADDAADDASPAALPAGTFIQGAGAADPAWLDARKLDYVRFASAQSNPASPANALVHLARRRLEPGYVPPGGPLPGGAWQRQIEQMDALEDGRDFDALYMINVLLGYERDPYVSPELMANVEAALARFKYWYTEPTPAGRRDDSYYWSENHQILFHTIEYLMGSRLPDKPIGADAKLGREHAEIAKKRILRWLDFRVRFGFTEWHSNVYYQKDITPLLTLIDYAPDEEIRARAASVLDTMFFDLALHTLKDAFGVTHGRSYKKDKLTSTDEDTWGITKLLFGQSSYPYPADDGGAPVLAATSKYAYPEIIRRAAADKGAMVDRERMSIPIHETAPPDGEPVAAYGYSYSDEADLMIWWGMGALTTYPVVPLTLETFDRYGLWDNAMFAELRDFKPLAASPDFAKNLSSREANKVNFGLMKEVDTYTYRTEDVMLSSAIDYRKGTFNQQMHAWQATLDARAIVFTNHPFRPLATTGNWRDDPENGGYWNGEATAPRSAQFENVGIHIYAPAYAKTNAAPFEYFRWEPYTHAYFPQEYFDEVAQNGNWTFGRLGKGYVALYSFRKPQFLVYDGVTQATGGRTKPFDLRADGGADNVFIVEVAREAEAGPFAAWQAAIAAAPVQVTSRGPGKPSGESDGFDVVYESPSRGRVTFGWEAPLVVRGEEKPLRSPGRYDNPWAKVPLDPKEVLLERDGYGLRIDVKNGRRTLFGP